MKLDHKIKREIIKKVTGLSKEELFLKWEKINLNKNQETQYNKYLQRIEKGEPIEYTLEKAYFFGIDFFVDKRVLIPRIDTEIMVERAIKSSKEKNTIIDIGTGSSCIAISILKNSKQTEKAFVIDISKKALEVSKINIKKHSLKEKIIQIEGNLLEKDDIFEKIKSNQIIITANLPYIKNRDYNNMDKEVIKYEPEIALYGGEKTGFELYEKLINEIKEIKKKYTKKEIILFIEIGFDQEEIAKKEIEKKGIKKSFFKDNSGIKRCIEIVF